MIMTLNIHLFSDPPITLWGLSSRERLSRTLGKKRNINWIYRLDAAPPAADMLLLAGDYLYDPRIPEALVRAPDTILYDAPPAAGGRPTAAHISAARRSEVLGHLQNPATIPAPDGVTCLTPAELVSGFQHRLRKIQPPYVLPITVENRRRLEKLLFTGSYKGVTDLVTKWLWPLPARHVTRWCATQNITPNQVTSMSLAMVIIASLCFYHGLLAAGLAAAWLMTFLDTVDGKLARVTVNSSTFGHLFDHIIDLVSPPLWYIFWGMGVEHRHPDAFGGYLAPLLWLLIGGYVAGRLVELVFKRWLEPTGIFCWRPLDSVFRLITGRRNPNLLLLTGSLIAGRPDIGLLLVVIWTVISSIFLVIRLEVGRREKHVAGGLRSWLQDDTVPASPLIRGWFTDR
ncbi:MAG: CDP-alcohol phosphatidyltransferase family protein [Deltaproteobacteria bacterium]|nr:CDP-alcohol phosphatidyltransferase family protein [Candidatus Anaeroferrophillacea bacterium]